MRGRGEKGNGGHASMMQKQAEQSRPDGHHGEAEYGVQEALVEGPGGVVGAKDEGKDADEGKDERSHACKEVDCEVGAVVHVLPHSCVGPDGEPVVLEDLQVGVRGTTSSLRGAASRRGVADWGKRGGRMDGWLSVAAPGLRAQHGGAG